MGDFIYLISFIVIITFLYVFFDVMPKRSKIKMHDYLRMGEIIRYMTDRNLDVDIELINNIGYSLGERPNRLSIELHYLKELSDENLYYLFATLIKDDVLEINTMAYLIFLKSSAEDLKIYREKYEMFEKINQSEDYRLVKNPGKHQEYFKNIYVERYTQILETFDDYINWMDFDSYIQSVKDGSFNQYFYEQFKKLLNKKREYYTCRKIYVYKRPLLLETIHGRKQLIVPVHHAY